VALLAAELEGQALLERSASDSPETAQKKAQAAQAVLESAIDLAASLGQLYEQAWALNSSAIGYFYQQRLADSEARYREALALAIELQDAELQAMVRGNLALVGEQRGDIHGALEELQAINGQLQDSASLADLAHNWSEMGRLYRRLYLFPEAITAHRKGLELWRELNSAEGMGRSGLFLAHGYREIGNPDTALMVLTEAMSQMESVAYGWGLRNGYGLMADLYRDLGRFEDMSRARGLQAGFNTTAKHESDHAYQR
jgi:tetratricopeptide (TPR) repeat protein